MNNATSWLFWLLRQLNDRMSTNMKKDYFSSDEKIIIHFQKENIYSFDVINCRQRNVKIR